MSARDEAVEMIRRICPAHLSADEYGQILAEKFDAYRTEILGEVTAWLVKKAREFRAGGRKADHAQADTVACMASKISRGAVRPDNLRMLPDPGFFEVDRTYRSNGWQFRVVALDTHPHSGGLHAVGWALDARTDRWTTASLNLVDWQHSAWRDVTGEVTR